VSEDIEKLTDLLEQYFQLLLLQATMKKEMALLQAENALHGADANKGGN
jgi:hypothetical protein